MNTNIVLRPFGDFIKEIESTPPQKKRSATKAERRGYADMMRINPTPAELCLEKEFRARGKSMRPYSTQKIKSHYILDFYFPQSKLAIEVDGNGHNNKKQRAYDIKRSKVLKKMGIKVVRFTNKEVLDDVIAVADRIYGIAIARERERKPKRSKRRAAR